MRYNPEERRTFPDFEDRNLWDALDNIGLPYDKIPKVAPPGTGMRENWYVTARVWYEDGKAGLIEWLEWRTLRQKACNRMNSTSIRMRESRIAAWRKEYPVLLLRRVRTPQQLEFDIKKWLAELKGE